MATNTDGLEYDEKKIGKKLDKKSEQNKKHDEDIHAKSEKSDVNIYS